MTIIVLEFEVSFEGGASPRRVSEDDEIEVCVIRDAAAILERSVLFIFNTVSGTAEQDEDYRFVNASAAFSAEEIRHCFTIAIESDNRVENTEEFSVSVTGDEALNVQTENIVIQIEDTTSLRVVFLSDSGQYVVEEGGTVEVCVIALNTITRDTQVEINVNDENGMDFLHNDIDKLILTCNFSSGILEPSSSTVTFTALQSMSCISLHPTDDLAIEDPTTTLTLAISSLDADLASPQTAMLSVIDNDGEPIICTRDYV